MFQVRRAIRNYSLLNKNDKVLVAFSGGPDSVCLLTVLRELTQEFSLSLHLAHLDHALRGTESRADAEWVEALADTLGIPIAVKRMDVLEHAKRKGRSLENLARDARYEFLSKTADRVNATKIATGHTRDDQAETVLLRLLRGAGVSGVAGIPAIRGRLIRPLIFVSRQAVVRYLEERGLEYRRDSSNKSRDYLRNRVRWEVMPLLEREVSQGAAELLARFAELARVDDSYLDILAQGALASVSSDSTPVRLVLDWGELKSLHPALARRVVRKGIEHVKGNLRGIGVKHVISSLELATGKRLSLASGVTISREYGRLIISCGETPCEHFSYMLSVPGTLHLSEVGVTVAADLPDRSLLPGDFTPASRDEAYFDFDEVHPPLFVRNRRPGDRMRPLGMSGGKKLKAIFIDDKIPGSERERIPLLTDSEGILWIVGNRRSQRAKVTAETKRFLRIRSARN